MFKEKINVCLLQAGIDPLRIENNFTHYRRLLDKIVEMPDIIVFPEMFACGFSDNISAVAQNWQEQSISFLQNVSKIYGADVVASLPVAENGKIFNRLFWISGRKIVNQYDKRHLFLGSERVFCTAGKERIVVNHAQWKIMPLICYDVRFPVWCRNQYKNDAFLYDCLLFVTNFPVTRSKTLQTLLKVRAIENQCYTICVNRVGRDGYGVIHGGNTVVINPIGEVVEEISPYRKGVLFADIEYDLLEKVRRQLPYYEDWDECEELKIKN